jgi:hypothetical protein
MEIPRGELRKLAGSFDARPPDAFDSRRGISGLFSDEAVLFLDRGARRRVTIEAAKDFAGNPAVGPLRTVFVEDIK